MPERFDRWRERYGPGWQPMLTVLRASMNELLPHWDAVTLEKNSSGELRFYIDSGDGVNPDNMRKVYRVIDIFHVTVKRTCEQCGGFKVCWLDGHRDVA